MIRAIILNADGILVGNKISNLRRVIDRLKIIRLRDIPIIFYTIQPHFSVESIIRSAVLANPHITDAGAVIIDPISKKFLDRNLLEKPVAHNAIEICLQHNIYVEFYTVNNYSVQENKISAITRKHSSILRYEPQAVRSLMKSSAHAEIIKVMCVAKDEKQKEIIKLLFHEIWNDFTFRWETYPKFLPLQFGMITSKKISINKSLKMVSKYLKIPLKNFLAFGNSLNDWEFMQPCGYVASINNDLELVMKREKNNFFITRLTNQNALLDLLDHFL